MRLSSAAEDCLLLVHRMRERQDTASTSTLARALGVTDSTVTAMVQKLTRLNLLHRPEKRVVTLTPKGEAVARLLIRRHRLIEAYLHQFLGYAWDEVHAEAERLEHVVSERLVEAISERLGHPAVDPHGDPIPDRQGHMPNRKLIRLSDGTPGTSGRVARVISGNAGLLVYLDGLGVRLGTAVHVLNVPAHDEIIHLRLPNGDVSIGKPVAAEIWIETAM